MSRVAEKLIQSAGELPSGADVLFENVIYQTDGDGTNGADNNTYTDSSSSPKTVTPVGDMISQGPMSPYRDFWAVYFDGSSLLQSSSGIDVASDNFTIEMWVWATETDVRFCAQNNTGGTNFYFGTNSAGNLRWDVPTGTSVNSNLINGGIMDYVMPLNQWVHVAAVREGTGSGQFKMYADGVLVAQSVDSSGHGTGRNINIAGGRGSSANYTGYISNFRFVVGSAVYTAPSTPSTTPLTDVTNTELLTCQSNRFIDTSSASNDPTIYAGSPSVTAFSPFRNTSEISMSDGGSATRLGGSDRLNISGTLPFESTGATFEAWIYTKSFDDNKLIFASSTNNTGRVGIGISCDTSGVLAAFSYTTLTTYITSTFGITKGQWNHIALTRSGNNHRFWINGVFAGYSNANPGSMPGNLDQGSIFGWTYNHPGSGWNDTFSMTDARLSTAELYTTAFTPPTAPLTSSASTVFLLNMTDAAIHNLSAITTTGTYANVDISTSVKKYGSGSVRIDGTSVGSYLHIGIQDIPSLGAGDFTIEFWLNPDSTTANQILVDMRNAGPLIRLESGKVRFLYPTADQIVADTSISAGAWTHVAVCREDGSTKMYIGGIAQSTVYADTNDYATGAFTVGSNFSRAAPLIGYIDDLRIVKGQAIYTQNFAPPTEALPKF